MFEKVSLILVDGSDNQVLLQFVNPGKEMLPIILSTVIKNQIQIKIHSIRHYKKKVMFDKILQNYGH